MSLISSPFSFGSNPKQSSLSFYSKVTTLPRIEHPSKLINEKDKNSLTIRGKSSDDHSNEIARLSSLTNYSNDEQIPDHINVTHGEDRDQIRLPIFGRRSSSVSSSLSNEQQRRKSTSSMDMNELESILKEKVRFQLHDIRTKFRHSIDFDSNGKISRQAFKHIIASIFGTQRQISSNQIDKLLDKLHLKHLTKISFDEFVKSLSINEKTSTIVETRQSSPSEQYLTQRTVGQMFLILKEKARTKNEDLVRFCPSLNGGPPSKIFKRQFHDGLIDMGYRMKDKEFDKLWDKFDPDGFHLINSEKFLKRLSNEEYSNASSRISRSETQDQQSSILKASLMKSSNDDHQLDQNRIQKWFNHQLPQCLSELEKSFQKLDPLHIGYISREEFLGELKRFGLILEENVLDFFLKRLNINLTSRTDETIDYQTVIDALKQRINLRKKTIQIENPLPEEQIRQTSLERQVEYLISMNFEQSQEKMRQLDKNDNGTINKNEMRSFIEDLLEFPLRHDEYEQLFEHFPIDQSGQIRYKDYFKRIYDQNSSLRQQQSSSSSSSPRIEKIPQWDYMRSSNIRESLKQEHHQKKIHTKQNEFDQKDQQNIRSIEELSEIIKTLIRTRYKDIEEQFHQIDYASYGELTQDYFYQLFQRLKVKPQITPQEIRSLWSICHLKESGTLDFYQFLRQFGYSKQSAHYPNAKQNPPKKGDADFLLTSNKLYGDSILVHESTRHSIKLNWDKLRRELTQLDPYRTGYIQSEEFNQILTEFCPSIIEEDLHKLKMKFDNTHDSRMNYVEFLKCHAPNDQSISDIDQSKRRPLTTTLKENALFPISSDRSLLTDVSLKVRRKLSYSYKQIRRSFKEEDMNNCGSISIKVFRKILNDYQCSLNDEEFYVLISELDTQMNGTINYNQFLHKFIQTI